MSDQCWSHRWLRRPRDLSSPNNPRGFVLTTVLGMVASVVATFLGRAIHLYDPDQGAGTIASIVGSLIVLWGLVCIRETLTATIRPPAEDSVRCSF
jgi:uncharacterized membrane protein YeaQ/YmgE (transglycosylase-associated protein family)